ncbi:FAD-dependent oxidoreductase [archaeon]|nr:MAG: FAD-dependent oxidoreductase [archaeon]
MIPRFGFHGIVRPNINLIRPVYKKDILDCWIKAVTLAPDLVEALELSEVPQQVSQDNHALAYFHIKKAVVFNPAVYLRALWNYTTDVCNNSKWICEKVEDLTLLTKIYDRIIIASGYGTPPLFQQLRTASAADLKVQYVRGRIYQYDNSFSYQEVEPLNVALLSGEYIVPTLDPESGQRVLSCGASHDHLKAHDVFSEDQQYTYRNKAVALSDTSVLDTKLQAKLTGIYPSLNTHHTLSIESSGIRLVTERTNLGRLPIVGQHPDQKQVYVLSGLGARGLVYHALMADYLVEAIITGNLDVIPSCLQPAVHSKSR